jgi:Carboxypeptidase regulatory-like domain/TonB dependent receptor-like, beta-barrel/TonB-dependent Receptor Plug Domain
MRRMLYGLLVVLAALLLHVPTVAAQVDRAALTGTVKDTSNAVVPGATVTARNAATNVPAVSVTDAQGTYIIGGLIPGSYVVEAELAGFKKSTGKIDLDVGQRARLDFVMSVGAVEQSVTVQAASPLVNTEQATLGTVISQTEIASLPLALRNWDDLIGGAAGVQGDRYTEQAGSTAAGRTGGFNVHGVRSLQNNFLLDGLDNNSISENVQELTTQVSRPSVDSIGEFKVVTSAYSAEFGRSPGAAVSVTTKSGTNQFRGTAYDYVRNDRFNSIDFFTDRQRQRQIAQGVTPTPKTDYRYNDFGANLGGPIVPNRAFFFGDAEATRLTQGVTRQTVVPTLLERQGIIAGTLRDPLTGVPFPNNTIPADRIDPVSRQLMDLFPVPNAAGSNNFFRNANTTDNAQRYLLRSDFHVDATNNVFARYYQSNRDRFIPGNFGGIADGTSTSAWGRQNMKTYTFAAGWNHTIGSAALNELRIGYQKADSHAVQDPFGLNTLSSLGIKGVPDDARINGGLPGINFQSGGYRLGSPDFLPKYQLTTQFQVTDSFSLYRGKNQWKFGVDLMMPMHNTFLDVPAMRGSVNFRNTFTGSVLGDFLLGYVSDASLSNIAETHQELSMYSVFAQDDWKPTSNVTVNAGIRYDFMTPQLERDNHISNFDRATATLLQAKAGSIEDRALVKPDRNNFAPRIGLTYTPTPKWVMRTGYGVFYNLYDRIGSEDQLSLNLPFLINGNRANATVGTGPIFFLKNGFPSDFLDPSRVTIAQVRVRAINPAGDKSYFQQWSGGIQREITPTIVVSADYVGTKGSKIWTLRNLNQPDPVTKLVPYPTVNSFIEYADQDGSSRYNGLELTLERRFRAGVGFRVAYTLSKATDNSGEHLFSGGSPSFLQDARNRDSWFGPADQDTRQRVAGNWILDVPVGTGRRWASSGPLAPILGGFTFSGVVTARTGRPFTVRQSSNNVGTSMTGLPNRIGDGEGAKTVDSWFNLTAFQAVPSGTFGNSGRNILRGPGLWNVDAALNRRFTIGGRRAIEARWEVFNLFNTVQLGLPDPNISNSTAGTISSLAGDPRVMQFALRVVF